jgi:hypothetical protein
MAITAGVSMFGCRSPFPCVLQCIARLRCITLRHRRPWFITPHRLMGMCGVMFATTDIIATTVTARGGVQLVIAPRMVILGTVTVTTKTKC